MADKLISTGLQYCIRHNGVIDCDQDVCDFAEDDEHPNADGEPRSCVPRQLVYRQRRRAGNSNMKGER